MSEEPRNIEPEDGTVRLGRGRFIGAGLAAAGAALAPRAAKAASRAVAAAAEDPTTPIGQLPLRGSFPNLPAIPLDPTGVTDTLAKLAIRSTQTIQSKQSLTHDYTLGGQTKTAYEFLFGAASSQEEALRRLEEQWRRNPKRAAAGLHRTQGNVGAADATGLPLEHPAQFSIGWTYFPNVYESGSPHLDAWSASLTDVDAATRQFWPMIAEHGYGYNLIIPERVRGARVGQLRALFGSAWNAQVRAAQRAGNLYVIDMSRFEALGPPETVNGAPRFTPATVTLLIRSPRRKSLSPVAITVSGSGGAGRRVFRKATSSKGAWLYALQAAKASITLWGVWLGHVYHWHIVTAAMQMAMYNTLPATHPVYQLLQPQSSYLIPFDNVLILGWSAIAPPTALTTPAEFYALCNNFATGRSYFDDDPTTTIQQLGLRQRDFTAKTAWDRYPVVQGLLKLWNLVSAYVDTFVSTTYASDADVAADTALQAFIATAGSADPTTGGNIRGLPAMDSRDALKKTLTSMVYRITAHGVSRLNATPNPALTFTANYPHCLQRTDIPGPRAQIGTRDLLGYLPNTNTITQSLNFYFIFAFSTPYVPFVPLGGPETELFFAGGPSEPRNRALIDLRKGVAKFIGTYEPAMPQRFQWPRNIET